MMIWPWNRKKLTEVWKWPHILGLNFLGWWAEEARTEMQRRWLSRYRAVLFVYFYVMSSTMIIATILKFVEGSVLENLFTVFISLTISTGVIKVHCLRLFRKTLKATMDCIDEMFLHVSGAEEEELVRKTYKKCWIIFGCYMAMSTGMSVHWVCRPIIMAVLYGERTRIFDMWPDMIDTWPQFAFSYCFQVMGMLGLGHAFYLFDNIFFCVSECLLCNFTLLKIRLRKLSLGWSQTRSNNLGDYITFYAKLLRACELLRDSTNTVLVTQSVLTVVVLCSEVFILTMTEQDNSILVMNLGESAILISIVYYFYCSYCNEITLQCQDVCNAAYMSDWIAGSTADKRSLQILMLRTERPVLFGGILKTDLSTFITIFKTIFSYYNFLVACAKNNGN